MSKKRRRADAVKLDILLERACGNLVEQGIAPTARKLSQKLGCQPSTLTRDTVRAEIIARFRADFEDRKRWSKRLEKSSNKISAELLQKKDKEIQSLRKQVDILLLSHRAMIEVLRSTGTHESWKMFMARYLELEKELANFIVVADDEESAF